MPSSDLANKNKLNQPGSTNVWSDAPAMPQESGDSHPIDYAVGSGSRPVPSKRKIDTSAPSDPHTLGRAPEGWLK